MPVRLVFNITWAVVSFVFNIIKTIFNPSLSKKGKGIGATLLTLGTAVTIFEALFTVSIFGISMGIPLLILGSLLMFIGKIVADN